MIAQWKVAALGALCGAALAVAIVFGAAWLGAFPQKSTFDGRQVRAYLLNHPGLVTEMMNRASDAQADAADAAQQAAMRAVGLKALFDPKLAFVTGPADARRTVVEFFDYNCVHCRNTLPALKAYYAAHRGDTRFAFVDYPIFGSMSVAAARAAVAARRQPDKYLAFSFAMMGEKAAIDMDTMYADAKAAGLDIPKLIADMKDPEIDKTLAAGQAMAKRLHIDGTPTFIFNGRVRPGEVSAADLDDIMAGKAI